MSRRRLLDRRLHRAAADMLDRRLCPDITRAAAATALRKLLDLGGLLDLAT
jgi:hypothetical protein